MASTRRPLRQTPQDPNEARFPFGERNGNRRRPDSDFNRGQGNGFGHARESQVPAISADTGPNLRNALPAMSLHIPDLNLRKERTMNKQEYKRAIRKARRIIAFLSMTDEMKMMSGIKISKAQALRLTQNSQFDNVSNAAEWADYDQEILFVGRK